VIAQSLVFSIVYHLVLLLFGHCIFCPSSICGHLVSSNVY